MTDMSAGRERHVRAQGAVPLISMRNIHKKFGSLHALRGASLSMLFVKE